MERNNTQHEKRKEGGSDIHAAYYAAIRNPTNRCAEVEK